MNNHNPARIAGSASRSRYAPNCLPASQIVRHRPVCPAASSAVHKTNPAMTSRSRSQVGINAHDTPEESLC